MGGVCLHGIAVPFFLVCGLLLHGVCAFFHIAFALLKSQLKDFHSTALDCVLFGVLYKIMGFYYRTILHH